MGTGGRTSSKPACGVAVNVHSVTPQVPALGAEKPDGMATRKISDDELLIVARIAQREGWRDLGEPPSEHGPRSIEEELAVARFRDAVPRRRSDRARRIRARVGVVAISLSVVGACWWVSPTRTAIGLFGAGLFSLIALRRSRRRSLRLRAG
jgi:hypothetical protein